MKLGGAIQSLQATQVGCAFIACYLVANPEYTPSAIQPYVSEVRNYIAFFFTTIFTGWWPFVAGKIFLLGACLFVAHQLFHVRKERKEEKRHESLEKANSLRMRWAREEAQRRLEEQAAEKMREELSEVTIQDAQEIPNREEDLARKERETKAARAKAQDKLQQAVHLTGGPNEAIASKHLDKSVSSELRASDRSQQQQQWVQKIQQQADVAVAAAAVPATLGTVSTKSSAVPASIPDASGLAGDAALVGGPSGSAEEPKSASTNSLSKSRANAPDASRLAGAAANVRAPAVPDAVPKSSSTNSLSRSRATGRAGSMIPLAVAQEAAERQQQWLQQLQNSLDAPEMAQQAAVEQDRSLRQEQDAEYQQALDADLKRQLEAEAQTRVAAAQAEQDRKAENEAAVLAASQKQKREQSRAALPEEPEVYEDASVLVRVRLPGGSTQQRRFLPDSTVDDVGIWVDTLEELPLSSTRQWKMCTNFPRIVPEGGRTVQELASGAAAVALFIELYPQAHGL